jgi:shikimate kinase
MLINDFFSAFKLGHSLANSATWKNRAILGNVLAAFLSSLVAIGKGLGYDLAPIDQPTIEALSAGAVALVTVGNAIVHVVTSEKVGLPGVPDGESDTIENGRGN